MYAARPSPRKVALMTPSVLDWTRSRASALFLTLALPQPDRFHYPPPSPSELVPDDADDDVTRLAPLRVEIITLAIMLEDQVLRFRNAGLEP